MFIVVAIVSINFAPVIQSSIEGKSKTIYVDDDNVNGPWNGTWSNPFQSIQDGIDNASIGDTVYVFNGTYYERICTRKPLRGKFRRSRQ